MPPYRDYINITCNGFSEQVILNEEGYTIGPESDGVTFVLFSYGYYPGAHVDKEAAKLIFSDIFSHGSSNVMCHNSVMELCVKGDRQIFKKCMEKRIETLRARIMRVSNESRWRRAYENNLRNFIRLYESIKYECSPAQQQQKEDVLVTKSSKELVNMVVFLMLQAKKSNPAYRKYEPIDAKEFIEPLEDSNAAVITDELLKQYMYDYSGKISPEIHAFLNNKDILQHTNMDATLQILQTLQNDPTIQNILIKHNNKQLLETTSDPAGVIRSIVTSIVNIHTRAEKELAEKLQKSGQEKAEMGNDLKIERSKQRDSLSSESDKLKKDLAEAHKATESVKSELSKIQLSDAKVQELKDEFIQAKKVYEETTANIQQHRNELERLRSSSPAGNILDFPAQIARKQGEMDALIEQNKALEQKISYYSNVIEGKFRKSPEYETIISSIKQI